MRVPSLLLAAALAGNAQQGWWMTEPIRWLQTNLRETDTALDPERLVRNLTDFRANVLLFGMGGIVAHYPTNVAFHQRSPHMPAGRDPFGEVLTKAHANRIRVVGRFDFSKTPKAAFDAHPEWFFRQASGEPVVYHGLYSVCINGGYYRQKAMEILDEALTRYDVDGLFFNMFGNQSTDYSGKFVGHCHCESCKRKFREQFHRELPARPDAGYELFMFRSSREVAADIGKLIRAKRPKAGYFNYIQQSTDGIMSESNTAVRRPLPLWPYSASDNVNRARNSEPTKMAVNLCMFFVDFPWRFATVPQGEISLRLWQNVSHGGAAALAMLGTMDQQDRQGLEAARPVYQWLAANEQYYAGQRSAARVLLLGKPPASGRGHDESAYRGMFRVLSEQHIPFAVADNLDWLKTRAADYDLLVAANWAPSELEPWVRAGGRLLVASSHEPGLAVGKLAKRWTSVQGYFRVRQPEKFPSLRLTKLLFLDGDYLEYEDAPGSLTLVPPSMFGPPEKVHVDQVDTAKPGLLVKELGKGRIAFVPWDAAGLYYRHSSQAHAGLLTDLIDSLLPSGRQIVTDAHPLVETVLMRQGARTLVHLVNLSGHSQTGYLPPIPMRDIRVGVKGTFRTARALRSAATLAVKNEKGLASVTVPLLADYEAVVLEP